MTEQDREREKRKSRLRSRMLVTDDEAEETDAPGADEDRYESRLFWHRVRRVLIILIPVCIIAGLAIFSYSRYQNKEFDAFSAAWSTEVEAHASSHYLPYGTGVLRYSQDGATYLNDSGEVVWNQAFEMRSPLVAVQGDYAAIADREGRSIFICDLSGSVGSVSTALPISNIAVASQGMVVALLEEDESCYIDFFDKNGTRLDIELKLWMGGEGYPIAMALSPSGTQLCLSCVYADAGTMQNKLAFYNFSEVGELLDEKLAGGFEIGDTVAPEVAFLSDSSAVAFLDDGIMFFSMEELSPKEPLLPEAGEVYTFGEEIRSVFYGSSHVGLVTESTLTGEVYHLYVYDASGREVFNTGLDLAYSGLAFSDYGVAVYSDSQCRIYNYKGQLRYAGELDGTISMLRQVSASRLIRVGDNAMTELVLK